MKFPSIMPVLIGAGLAVLSTTAFATDQAGSPDAPIVAVAAGEELALQDHNDGEMANNDIDDQAMNDVDEGAQSDLDDASENDVNDTAANDLSEDAQHQSGEHND